ncbi:MAG TPA: BCD family MFS transporter [Roseiflexaceae bacterium]|nr:BCD family MFS transporter [Roseiflexaceae bacterium]
MSILSNIRLGLLHVAVAITFVLINGILNRIMIHDLGILASVVAALIIIPYLLSPAQVWLGQYSDTHPIFGYRRTPYIALGLLLCIGGALGTPAAAFSMGAGEPWGWLIGLLTFGIWGIGFNMSVVGYLSLASDMSDEVNRSRTIAIMWFMMILSIIITAIATSRALEPYSDERLIEVFWITGGIALAIALAGLIGLEPRSGSAPAIGTVQSRTSQVAAIRAVLDNRQARYFFLYLILLLAAILGQDVLLEPFGAAAFGMSVRETTQLTAIWGGATLLALLLSGLVLSRRMTKKAGAALGGFVAVGGLLLIALSGIFETHALFIPGVAALGFGTGIATATNLALMLGMTTTEQVGLFIGAWGVADSLARGVGMLLGGVVRDLVAVSTGNVNAGYITVFLIEAALLGASLILLRRLDVQAFRDNQPTLTELVAIAGDT